MLRRHLQRPRTVRQDVLADVPGVYFTGDGARRDEDGYFWITGRVDDVINVSGHRLGTAEIETALVSHPAVAEAAVVATSDELTGQAVVAYVTLGADVARAPRWKPNCATRWPPASGSWPGRNGSSGPTTCPRPGPARWSRLLRDVAEGREPGNATTLRDASVLAALQQATAPGADRITGQRETGGTS